MDEDTKQSIAENERKIGKEKVSLETTIDDFLRIVGHKERGGILPLGIYLNLMSIGKYINTIGELNKLAESADGFGRLKNGVYFNKERRLPYTTMKRFGKYKLDILNTVLEDYGIEPIPWITRKYKPWERRKQRGDTWSENLTI